MDLGHEVLVFGENTKENEPYNVPGVMCYDRFSQDSYMNLVAEADKWKPDIMHWQFEHALHQTSGPVVELANERPHFMTWHNVIPDSKSYWYGWLADRQIVHNKPCADALGQLRLGGAIIPHGTRKNTITPRDKAKELLGIGADRKVIATFGFVDPRKGFHIITTSWPRVKQKCPKAFYLCIGGRHPGNPGLRGFYQMFEDQLAQYPKDFMSTGYMSDEDKIDLALSAADVMVYPHLGGQEILSASGSVRRCIDNAPLLVVQDINFYSDIPEDCAVRIPPMSPYIPFGRWLGTLLNDCDNEKYCLMKTQLKLHAMKTYWSEVAKMHIEKYNDFLSTRGELIV
jgi:glycosyltransferase involved in cell wall biosynthesis